MSVNTRIRIHTESRPDCPFFFPKYGIKWVKFMNCSKPPRMGTLAKQTHHKRHLFCCCWGKLWTQVHTVVGVIFKVSRANTFSTWFVWASVTFTVNRVSQNRPGMRNKGSNSLCLSLTWHVIFFSWILSLFPLLKNPSLWNLWFYKNPFWHYGLCLYSQHGRNGEL